MGIASNVGSSVISAAGGLLGAGASAASQSSTNATNLQIARETNQANKELAEQQNQWNLEQWNRENEYNSPAQQLQRLQEAGLNPSLVNLGSSTSNHLESASLANQQPTQVQNPLGSDFVAAMSSAFSNASNMIRNAQDYEVNKKRLNLDKDVANYQKENLFALTQSYLADTFYKNSMNKYSDTMFRAQLFNEQARGENLNAQTDNIRAQQDVQRNKTIAETDEIKSRTRLNEIEAKWKSQSLQAQISLLYSSVDLNQATANTANSVLPYIIAGHKLSNEQISILNDLHEQEKKKFGFILQNLDLQNQAIKVGIDQAKFNLSSDETYKNAERSTNIAKGATEAAKNVSSEIRSWLKPF